MLGNDVVDLTINTEKYLSQRFVNRVLTHNEIKQLDKSADKNIFLWSLWSIKEASYKACQKTDHQLLFSPSQFELNQSCLFKLNEHDMRTPFYGTLEHQKITLQLKLTWNQPDKSTGSVFEPNAVHATAISSEKTMALNAVQIMLRKMTALSNYKNQSSEVRKLATSLLASNDIFATIQRPPVMIKDYSKPGPPVLVKADQSILPHEISLSHDNNWLAVALLIK